MADDSIALRELLEKSTDAGSAARDDRLCRRAADRARGVGPDRRRPWRAHGGAAGAAQRLSRPGLGDPRRDGRAAHPQAQEGQLLPRLPGAAAGGREGAHGRHPGAYVQGVSTRSVDELVKALGLAGISKSQVSRLCAEIDERVRTFLERPIEGDWPYLWIDATYVKVREAGRIVSVAVTIAVAVKIDGRREVLGMAIGASEAETFWLEFLRKLKRRGLAGVKLVISDAHEGIKAAVARVFRAS